MASAAGRGAQVILTGADQVAARGAFAPSIEGNTDVKRVRELFGLSSDGSTPDGSARNGAPALSLTTTSGRKPRIAIFGDSRTRQNHSTDNKVIRTIGYAYWAAMALNSRVDFPPALNFGINGDTTSGMRVRLGPVLASDADVVVMLAGTNNWGAGITIDQTIADMQAMIASIRDAGKLVVLVCEAPRGDTTFPLRRLTTSQLANHIQWRQWLLDQRFMRGVYTTDAWADLAVPGSTTGDAIVGMFYDGLHPAQLGARAIGTALAATLATIFPSAASDLAASNADVYDAVNNPYGSLTPNPMLDGTGGTVNAGVTGQVATSLQVAAPPSGLSIAASKVTTGNKVWQQLVITGTPAANASIDIMRMDAVPANIGANDTIYGSAEIQVDSGGSGYQSLQFGTRTTHTTAGTVVYQWGDPDATIPPPTTDYGGAIQTPLAVMPGEVSTTARLKFYITVANGVAVNLTIRVRAMALRKVRPGA